MLISICHGTVPTQYRSAPCLTAANCPVHVAAHYGGDLNGAPWMIAFCGSYNSSCPISGHFLQWTSFFDGYVQNSHKLLYADWGLDDQHKKAVLPGTWESLEMLEQSIRFHQDGSWNESVNEEICRNLATAKYKLVPEAIGNVGTKVYSWSLMSIHPLIAY